MASLPQVGVQAVVLGMAAFTANARSVESQIAMMGAASYRLERASGQSFGGVIGALRNLGAAAKEASRVHVAAVQAQTTAAAVASLKITQAQESVATAYSASVAKQIASIQTLRSAEAQHASSLTSINQTLASAQQAFDQQRVKSALVERQLASSRAVASSAAASTLIANEKAIQAAHTARIRQELAESLLNRAGPNAPQVQEAQTVALAAKLQADAYSKMAESARAHSTEVDRLLKKDLAASVSANEGIVASEARLTAATQAASQARIAADQRLAAAKLASTSAIRAANASMTQSEIASSIAITAAEEEKAIVTQVSAAQQIAADAAVKASKIALALAVVATAAIITAAILAIGAAAIIMGQKYERALAFTGAVSGASAAQVKALDAAHMHLASTTTTSAGALNEISAELLKAGNTVQQVLEGSLEATNNLVVASAGELKAADAAVLMQVAMEGFGVSATRAADATTVAVQKSTLTFGEFADAIRQGGANAANAGMSFDAFSTVIGVMGLTINSGSEAATSLRVMLQRMQNPTKEATGLLNQYNISLYDAAGKARPFRDVISDLSDEFSDSAIKAGKLTQAERDRALAVIFGQRASKGAIALIRQGTEEYDKMAAAIEQVNAAQLLANQLLLPTGAQLEIIRNRVEVLGIALNKGLDPFINKVVSSTLAWLQTLNITEITAFGEAVGGAVYNAFANLGSILDTTVVPAVTMYMGIQNAVVKFTFTLVAALLQLLVHIGKLGLAWAHLSAVVIGEVIASFGRMVVSTGEAKDALINLAISGYNAISQFVSGVIERLNTAAKAFVLTLPQAAKDAIDFVLNMFLRLVEGQAAVEGSANALGQGWAKIWSGIGGVAGKAVAWIMQKLDGLFNFMSNLPIVGEAIGYARSAVGTFLGTDVPTFIAASSNAVQAFSKDVRATLNQFGNFKMPEFHDFAGDVKKSWDAAADARKGALGKGSGSPAGEPTEAGDYPVKDDSGADALKKLESALKKADELIDDFNDDVASALSGIMADVLKLYGDAFNKVNEALAEHEQAINKAMEESGKAVAAMFAAKDLQDNIDARKKALDDTLKFEEDWRAQALASGELWHQRQLEDDQRYYDALRQIREDAFDEAQEVASRARALVREDEDIAYQASLDAREAKLAADQDILEAAFDRELEAKEATLKAIQDAEERDLKKSQDRRERALRAILDAEKLARNQKHDVDKLNSEDARDRSAVEAEYQKQLGLGVKASIAKTRRDEALAKIGLKTGEDRAKLTEDHAWENATEVFDTGQQSRMDALKADFDKEDLAQQTKHNSEKLALDQQLERDKTAFSLEQERVRDELRNTIDKEARDRTRAREVEDRLFSEQQERDKNLNSAKEDAKALSNARTLEDAERERKRKNDLADALFKKEQDDKRQTLEKQLEAEDFQRRLDNIYEEERIAIASADTVLQEDQRKTREKLAQDIIDLRQNVSERIDTLRENYLDKLEDIMDDANINTKASEITNTIAIGLYAIRDAAQAATDKLAGALGAARELTTAEGAGQAGRDWWADKNFAKGTGMSDEDAESYANSLGGSKQYGGVVPGRFGSPVPIMAHGGESYEGMGAQGVAMTAVRTAEAMLSRGIGGRPNVSSHTEYNVNANYGRVQTEGSLMRDLSALVTLTK